MSTTVDERVVEMRFDNRQFEDGVQTSMSSLERLRNSLNLEGATRGLEAVDNAAKNCKMTPLSDAVDSVKVKFSALQIVAVTALQNITNSAINMGKRLIKSFTVDPIKDGFSEYELKMGSVQTIMNGTGESLDTVMGYLNELNTYADKTIYSFSDMTSNIGKFTNAGVNLKDSVKAIQGVSNVAAISGANTADASRAMYNFAQALSSGSVKLIDWKSIENANMATVEFKNELLKTALALGTVKKVGDKYKTTTKNAKGEVSDLFNATSAFNDSLSFQWMTSDVLVKTLGRYSDETTAIGKKAFAAAQDVKTFSQLMDTLKEAVGSGWSETWELIFGNFDEAKALWTGISSAVGGFIDNVSKSRNALLQEWKDLGGRTALIESFRNTIKGIVGFIKPINNGFKDIFPAVTGKRLAEITKNLKDFTDKFKIGDKTAERIKNSFKGLFAVLDIGGQAFFALLGGTKRLLTPVIGAVLKLGGGVLSATSRLGNFITSIDQYLKKNRTFEKAVSKVVDVIFSIPPAINRVVRKITGSTVGEIFTDISHKWSEAVTVIKSILSEFRESGSTAIDSISNKFSTRFKPLSALVGGLKKLFDGIKSAVSKTMPLLGALAMSLGRIFSGIGDALSSFISNTDFDHVLDLVSSGLMINLGLGLKNFIDNLSEATENAGGFVSGIKKIFDGITDCLSTMQDNLKADILKKIAVSVGILAASLFVLSLIDSDKLAVAFGTLTGIFVDLFASMAIYQRMAGGSGILTLNKVSKGMVTMAAAVLILSFAVKNIASLEPEKAAQGVAAIGFLCGELIGALAAISATVKRFGTVNVAGIATGLFIISMAVVKLAKSIQVLGDMKIADLGKGMLGMASAMTALLVAFLAISATVKKFGKINLISISLGLLILSSAILIMAKSIAMMGTMKMADLGKGMLGVAAAMVVLVGAFTGISYAAKKFGSVNMAGAAFGLLIMASSLLIMAKVISVLGGMEQEKLVQGMNGVAVSLGLLVSAFIVMSAAVSKFGKINVMSIATAILIVSTSMLILAKAIQTMGSMSWEELVRGLVIFASTLGAIVGTFVLVSKFASGNVIGIAFAILVVASAIAVLTPVLKALGQMPIWDICKALLAIAGVFAILGGAAYLLTPLIPAILSLSGSLLLLGLGLTGIGAGLLMIGAGITSLSISLTAATASIIASLKLIIVGLISIIPDTIKALISIIPALMDALKEIILSTVDVIAECAPAIIDCIVKLIYEFLKSLSKYGGPIVDYLVVFLINVINALAKRIPDLLKAIFNFIGALFSGITNILGGMNPDAVLKALAGITLITVLIYALSAIVPLIPAAMLGVLGLGAVITELALVLAAMGLLSKIPGLTWLIGEGGNLLQTIGVSIGKFFGGIIGGIAKGATSQLPAIADDISMFMLNLQPFIEGAKAVDTAAMDGIKSLAEAILILTASSVLEDLTSWFTGGTSLARFGEELAAFAPYLKEFSESVKGVDGSVIQASANAALALAEFAKTVPNSGGIAAWFAGENSLSAFADELIIFGPKLKQYADSVKGLDTGVVENSANAAMAIFEMSEKLPNQGGMVSWFTGDNTLSTFGDELAAFAPGLKKYADSISGLDSDVVISSTNAAMALSELANNLPNSGGMASWFAGDNDLASFGQGLSTFGEHFAAYAEHVQNVNPEVVTATASAAVSLSELAENLPKKADWFSDDMSLPGFGKAIASFGRYFGQYYDSISGINTSVLSAAVRETKNLLDIAKGMNGLDTGAIGNFGKSLQTLGNTGVDEFINAFTQATERVSNAADSLITSFVNGVNAKKSECMNAFTSIVTDCITAIRAKQSDFYNVGGYVAQGFASGITANQFQAQAASAAMANAAMRAAERKLEVNSPSKAFYRIGNYAGLGFVNALGDNESVAYDSGAGLASKAMKGLSEVISRISEFINSDIDAEPTIRPVLDLSEIQNGVKRFEKLMPGSDKYAMSNSFELADSVQSGMRNSGFRSDGASRAITINANFYEANQRDGMAIISLLNRELGGQA